MAGAEASCEQCGTANPAHALFCMSCGASLARSCVSCGADVPPAARFCMACGATTDAAEAPTASTSAVAASSEQRRTVTVLFADLSGFTAVAERLDHETVKTLIERCLTRFAAEVESFGGRVDKYIGDNVMAVFGAPVAHEDDPERAVRERVGERERRRADRVAGGEGLTERATGRTGGDPRVVDRDGLAGDGQRVRRAGAAAAVRVGDGDRDRERAGNCRRTGEHAGGGERQTGRQ